MNNTITLINQVGYYHPSNANWSYEIYTVTIIKDNEVKNNLFYKGTFGAYHRVVKALEGKGIHAVHNRMTNIEAKHKDIKYMADIELGDSIDYIAKMASK